MRVLSQAFYSAQGVILSALESEGGVALSRMFTVERMAQTRQVRHRDGVNLSLTHACIHTCMHACMHAGAVASHNVTSATATLSRLLRQSYQRITRRSMRSQGHL
jgi:hypothetical protein